MKDYSTPAEGILKREADGTIASQEVTEVELVDLATVATSGSYNDLTDKPTMPTDTLGKNIVGTSATASSNGAVSGTDGVYLNHIEGTNTVKSTHKIVGSGATTVKSDANGNITINTPATDISKLQPKITANGFLYGDGSGNITADKPVFTVNMTPTSEGDLDYTADKTVAEIVAAYEAGYTVQAVCQVPGFPVSMTLPLAAFDKTTFDFVFIAFSVASFMGVSTHLGNLTKGWTIVHDSPSENWRVVEIGIVPDSRTINTKPLSANVTLNASDVNAVGLTGDQTIAGSKIFTGEVTFEENATTSFYGGLSTQGEKTTNFNTPVSFNGTVEFTPNATISGLKGLTPTVTTSNNGQFLRVVNGAWAATTVENANGVSF